VFLVDTNVLVYAVNKDCPEHDRCYALLHDHRAQLLPWFATWPILYEFLRIVTHPRSLRKPWTLDAAWNFIDSLLRSPGLRILVETDRHSSVLSRTLGEIPSIRGSFLHDAHTAVLMREHGVKRIYTRDTGFHRFPFLEVIDPMVESYGPQGARGGLEVREPAASGTSRRRARPRR